MALKPVKLFCSDCREKGNIWERDYGKCVFCKTCGKEWNKTELNEICTQLIQRAESDRNCQHYAACLRILMHYIVNPMTGKTYA